MRPRIYTLQVQTVVTKHSIAASDWNISRLTRVFRPRKSLIGTLPRKKKPLVPASVMEWLSTKLRQRLGTRLILKNRLVMRLPQFTEE